MATLRREALYRQKLFDLYIGNKDCVSALVLRLAREFGDFMTLGRIRQSVHAFHPPQFYARLPRWNRLRGALDIIRKAKKESSRPMAHRSRLLRIWMSLAARRSKI